MKRKGQDAMKISLFVKTFAVMAGLVGGLILFRQAPTVPIDAKVCGSIVTAVQSSPGAKPSDQEGCIIYDKNLQLCQGFGYATSDCDGSCGGHCAGGCSTSTSIMSDGFGYGPVDSGQPAKMMRGIDEDDRGLRREAHWRNGDEVPFESFSYGEYIGPQRTPHVADYQLRVGDQLEFVFLLTREKTVEPYQFYVGDVIQISSPVEASLNQTNIKILPDGSISINLIGQVRTAGKTVLDLQNELNEKYKKFVKNPSIVVQVLTSETPLLDLVNSVDARQGQGGQSRRATVTPDGTIQLPLIGSSPAIGLTLAEAGREINARYRQKIRGIEVTPILIQRAPRFIYVVGEVRQGGRFELTGPTSSMQAVALAGGFAKGGNLRQIIVFRRDQNWKLTATKLDLAGALNGKSPQPADEIWLRDSDIILIPKKPIQRLSDAVDLYMRSTVYGIFPQSGVRFNFDNVTSL